MYSCIYSVSNQRCEGLRAGVITQICGVTMVSDYAEQEQIFSKN